MDDASRRASGRQAAKTRAIPGNGGRDPRTRPAAERARINTIIFEELVKGVFREPARAEYVRVIERLAARGCDAVALVCTEIPLLVTPEVSPLPTLDSTRLLARAALEVAIGKRAVPTWRGGRSGAEGPPPLPFPPPPPLPSSAIPTHHS